MSIQRVAPLPDDSFDDISERIQAMKAREEAAASFRRNFRVVALSKPEGKSDEATAGNKCGCGKKLSYSNKSGICNACYNPKARKLPVVSSDPQAVLRRKLDKARELFGVGPSLILGKRRLQYIVRARQAVMVALVESGMSRAAVGRLMGKDHTTVIFALHAVPGHARLDPQYAQDVKRLVAA